MLASRNDLLSQNGLRGVMNLINFHLRHLAFRIRHEVEKFFFTDKTQGLLCGLQLNL